MKNSPPPSPLKTFPKFYYRKEGKIAVGKGFWGSLEKIPNPWKILVDNYYCNWCLFPTRSAINCKCCLRNNVSDILDPSSEKLYPTLYGWEIDNFERLLPAKHLKLLPSDILTICKCRGRCATRQCPCRKAGVACMLFCHNKDSNAECCNKIAT